jgi:hypothetical protein
MFVSDDLFYGVSKLLLWVSPLGFLQQKLGGHLLFLHSTSVLGIGFYGGCDLLASIQWKGVFISLAFVLPADTMHMRSNEKPARIYGLLSHRDRLGDFGNGL